MKSNTPDRILSRLQRSNGCLEWTGSKAKDGYGHTRFKGRLYSTHRLMWQWMFGPIPEGLHCLHRCDNPACADPDHLFLGTDADNARDRNEKGRTSRVSRNRGEEHPCAKLSDQQVRSIRRGKRGVSQRETAREFQISQSLVSLIRLGKAWAHVGDSA